VWQAVVSQPSNREARLAAPGKLDASLGEFWVENPWEIITKGHNLSAYERDRLFLNHSGAAAHCCSSRTSFPSGITLKYRCAGRRAIASASDRG
jgi:hypothetical protein